MSTKNFVSYGDAETIFTKIANAIKGKKDEYETITYAQWQQLTPAQQAAKDYYISDYPSSILTAGNISYDNTESGMAANKVQGAIDELKSGLANVNTITNQCSFDVKSIRATFNAQSKVVSFDVRSNDGFTTSTWTPLLTITDATLAPAIAMYFPVVFINANRDEVVGHGVGKLDTNNIISVNPDNAIPAYSEAVGIVMWQ